MNGSVQFYIYICIQLYTRAHTSKRSPKLKPSTHKQTFSQHHSATPGAACIQRERIREKNVCVSRSVESAARISAASDKGKRGFDEAARAFAWIVCVKLLRRSSVLAHTCERCSRRLFAYVSVGYCTVSFGRYIYSAHRFVRTYASISLSQSI